MLTAQLTLDLPDKKVNCACAREATLGYCVKYARVREHTARIFLVLEQIKGNLSSYGGFCIGGAELSLMNG